jgi:DnaJ-class molecular chaperone
MNLSEDLDLNPMKPYEVLGVSPEDSLEKIKSKFNKQILKYHPDRLSGSGLTDKEKKSLEKHCHKLIRSYKIIKRNLTNLNDYDKLKNLSKESISIPTSYPQKDTIIDNTIRFKSVDDYLSFNVPKPPKNNKILSARDFNDTFTKSSGGVRRRTQALVLRTSDGFTGYNIDQFNSFAKDVEGKDLLFQHPIVWEN